MPFLSVVLLGLFTLAVVRLLGARATLSNRTLFAFLALGALIGPPSLQIAYRFFDPYSAWGNVFSRNLVIFFVSHLLILMPMFVYFFGRRVYTAASVADAFLLGFVLGFGYDFIATLSAAAYATATLRQLTIVPPFTFDAGGFSLAGNGYWAALGALAMAAGLRFLRNRYVAFGVAAFVILFFAAEAAALIQPVEAPGHWFALVTVRGTLTPYLALVALVVCSFLEFQWMNRLVPAASQRKLQVLGEWQALLNALLARRFHEFRRLGVRMRLERNVEIARAELAAHNDDAALKKELEYLDARLAALPSGASATVLDLPVAVKQSARHGVVQWVVVVLFVGVCFVLPMLPADVVTWFWGFQLFQYPLPGLGVTILDAALVALIVWRYLASPAWSSSRFDPDELLDYSSEMAILRTALGLALIAVLYGPVDELFNFGASPPTYVSIWFPGLNRVQMTTNILLLAAAATGLTLHRLQAWKLAPLGLRRASAIHNAITVLAGSVTIWAALVFFGQMQAWTHEKLGAWLFNHFGPAGNSAGDIFAAVLTGGFTYAIVTGLLVVSDRAEAFLAGPAPKVKVVADASGAGR